MNEKNEVIAAAATSVGKARWSRPGVDRFAAGGARGSADITSDGVDNPS